MTDQIAVAIYPTFAGCHGAKQRVQIDRIVGVGTAVPLVKCGGI
ncbi:hypothetical protein QM716_11955 [Rhodococcus sp. IEGM 1409]|nr:hypothetical protein [Rhodococcus sp. IEGM 1409]